MASSNPQPVYSRVKYETMQLAHLICGLVGLLLQLRAAGASARQLSDGPLPSDTVQGKKLPMRKQRALRQAPRHSVLLRRAPCSLHAQAQCCCDLWTGPMAGRQRERARLKAAAAASWRRRPLPYPSHTTEWRTVCTRIRCCAACYFNPGSGI